MQKQKKLTEEQNINDVKKFNSDEGLMVVLDSVEECKCGFNKLKGLRDSRGILFKCVCNNGVLK